MIHTIAFKDPKDECLPEGIYPSHTFKLPAIKGKTFEFKPGLNVIVGRNGCGKTSLIDAIRYLTFCDQVFGSSIARGRESWELHTRDNYERGFWHLAELKAQHIRCTFNLRKKSDFNSYDFANSSENFLQAMGSMRSSDGQNVMAALNMMVRYYKYGENWRDGKEGDDAKNKDEHGLLPHQSFETMVLSVIRKNMKRSNDLWKPLWDCLLKYYVDNNDETYKGPTFLMDEPDKGMDVHNLNEVFKILTVSSGKLQDIVVLHNIGLIHRLMKLGDKVNFIEMTDGYLDEVEKFFKE